ncbi:YjgN family protein [Acinetobacter puyangensis]|uniref:Uncharacterized membrane protein YjgN, DUF898 family n=1 Tax=Acinetobacter puyangensis TaxID=1096779 RepID=A0A240E5Q0_9GAMM|nr:YjgN family protein [Acinetobacter puyangensis]SNX43583.1 Uncharacterized membrane protein YjgN, DUF898 family [Acinetobacter puyangensis]
MNNDSLNDPVSNDPLSNHGGSSESVPPQLPDSTSIPPAFDHVELSKIWRFAFRGTGLEYFKIWITNLFLTIITLTLYAPWAKVRRLRYFYGNTYLNRRKFDFTGIPVRILVGRLIALGLYFIFILVSQLSVEIYAIAFIVIMLCVPWLIRSSTRFKARNSKYENSRFYFSASMKHTYWVFFCCVIITVLSLGILYPIALLWFKRYQLNHLYVGQLQFKLKAEAGDFFVAVLLPSLAFMVLMIIAIALVAFSYFTGFSPEIAIGLAGILYILAIFYLGPLIQGYLFKATWSNVEVGSSQMQTDINPWKFAWIQMSNSIAIIFSIGLLYAWAMVRIYRYKIQSLSLTFNDDPQHLINMAQKDYNAIGEEVADIFDFDISL